MFHRRNNVYFHIFLDCIFLRTMKNHLEFAYNAQKTWMLIDLLVHVDISHQQNVKKFERFQTIDSNVQPYKIKCSMHNLTSLRTDDIDRCDIRTICPVTYANQFASGVSFKFAYHNVLRSSTGKSRKFFALVAATRHQNQYKKKEMYLVESISAPTSGESKHASQLRI